MKKRLHKAIAETLAELREAGVDSIVNLLFYDMVKVRMKTLASSNHSIAVYMVRHRNEFKTRLDESYSTHVRGAPVSWRIMKL